MYMNKAIAYASQVIDQGSTQTYDYLLLDGLLARSGNLPASIATLKKGINIAPYDRLLYESLAVRQLSRNRRRPGDAPTRLGSFSRGPGSARNEGPGKSQRIAELKI